MTTSSPYVVRAAAPRDLRHFAAIENAGVPMFEALLGDLTGDVLATPAVSGGAREDRSGFLLVAAPPARDVPWNGPFYRSMGFAEATMLEPYQRRLRAHEAEIGLDRHGSRAVMTARLDRRP